MRRVMNDAELLQQQNRPASSSNSVLTANMTRPDVQLKRLPFYDIIAEVMKPTCLGMFCISVIATLKCVVNITCVALNYTNYKQHVKPENSYAQVYHISFEGTVFWNRYAAALSVDWLG